MRISDWSSDVCSSDLIVPTAFQVIEKRRVACDARIVDENISRLDLGRRRGDAVGGGNVEGNGPARAYGRGTIRRDGVEALASPRRDHDIGTGAGQYLCEKIGRAHV